MVVSYSTPNLTDINTTFMNSESFHKASSRNYIFFHELLYIYRCWNLLNEPTKVCEEIKKETELLSSSTLRRRKLKYQRDGITIFIYQHKNRRFRKLKKYNNPEKRRNQNNTSGPECY